MLYRRLVEESVSFGIGDMRVFVEMGVVVELRCVKA